jgi:hypothetical protein
MGFRGRVSSWPSRAPRYGLATRSYVYGVFSTTIFLLLFDLPEQQHVLNSQKRPAPSENATASQTSASILVPTEPLILYCFSAVSNEPARAPYSAVEVMAPAMMNMEDA